tara:strand:- start:318 stop:542 length:225 start_codon:yes stop_codon:yes gene_type:complete
MLYVPAKLQKDMSFDEAVETVKWEGDLLGGMEVIRDNYYQDEDKPNFWDGYRAVHVSAYNIVFVGMNKLFNGDK